MLGRSQTCPTCREGTSWSRTSRRPASRGDPARSRPRSPGPDGGHARRRRRGGDAGHRVAVRDAGRGDPGRHGAVGRGGVAGGPERHGRRSRPAPQNDTAEIPTSIDVEVPPSSPTEDRAVLLARLQLLETENARLRATATVPPPAAAGAASAAQGGPLDRRGGPDPDRRPARAGRGRGQLGARAGRRHRPLRRHGGADRRGPAGAVGGGEPDHDRGRRRAERQGADHAGDRRGGGAGPAAARRPGGHLVAGSRCRRRSPAFIRKNVTKIVSSDAFENIWEEANRAAHEQIVATLRGRPGRARADQRHRQP